MGITILVREIILVKFGFRRALYQKPRVRYWLVINTSEWYNESTYYAYLISISLITILFAYEKMLTYEKRIIILKQTNQLYTKMRLLVPDTSKGAFLNRAAPGAGKFACSAVFLLFTNF